MRYKQVAVALVATAGMLAGGAVAARDLKIGAVDLGQLVQQSPQAQRARARMRKKFASRKQGLQSKQDKLQSDVKRLKRDGPVMSDDARGKLQSSIRDQQRRLRLAQSEYNDDVQQAEQQELKTLRGDIRDVINDFAKRKGYDLILGDGILFAGKGVDITDQVLALLKKKK